MSKQEDDGIELYSWDLIQRSRGGQHVASPYTGVLAIHRQTGIAFLADGARSQMTNGEDARRTVLEMLRTWQGQEQDDGRKR